MTQTEPTCADLRRLRIRFGTQADTADALGVSLRSVLRAETDEAYPRRRLMAYAVRGLLAEAGIPDAPYV